MDQDFQSVFISYGRVDSKAFATQLYRTLTEQGYNVWFDQNNIPLAVDFQDQIDVGIQRSDNFLFIISPHSVNSPYCQKEIELAVKYNKRIIPLLHVEQINQEIWQQRHPNSTSEEWKAFELQGKHSSFPNMHSTISKINWIYFRESIDSFEMSLTQMLEVFKRQKEYVHQHTKILIRAKEWKRYQKQAHYLLSGEDRQQAESWLKERFENEQCPCLPTDLHCEFICESIKNANSGMTQVLIVHAEEDDTIAAQIARSLTRKSFTVWTSKTDVSVGATLGRSVEQGIEEANNIVYLLSPVVIQSKYCQKQIEYALSLNKRIIPLLVRETDANKLQAVLRGMQYIDLIDNLVVEDYQQDESQLLKALLQDSAYHEDHKLLLVKALRWERQKRNPSILLRGYNLRKSEAWLKLAKQRGQHLPTSLQEEFITESLLQSSGVSLDVFVSYSRVDSDFARRLNDALQLQGKTTWFDQESLASGTDFQHEIYRGIEESDNFLFILSPRSVNSPYCIGEVEYAASLNKRFVTVLHQSIEIVDLHPKLAKIQWLDFNQNSGDFYTSFNLLIRTLGVDREYVRNHTKWSQRSLEWEQKNRDEDLLLRGSELAIANSWLQEGEQQGKKPLATDLHKEFILASVALQNHLLAEEEGRKQREINLIQAKLEQEVRARKLAQTRNRIALISLLALTVLSGFSINRYMDAQSKTIEALSASSKALFVSDAGLDALIEALRAGTRFRRAFWVDNETRSQVLTALQQAVFRVKEYNRLEGHSSQVWSAIPSPDGQMIASAGGDNTVMLWRVDGSLIKTLRGHQSQVFSVAFSPDSQMIVSGSADKTVKLWRNNGTLIRTFEGLEGHRDEVKSVSFSPDGQIIASGSTDKTIKLWRLDGTLIKTLTGHTKDVRGVSFSCHGILASASFDKTIRLWSSKGSLLRELKGHNDSVNAVSFSPNGKILASASDDKTVKLWKRDGTLIRTLAGHTGIVWSTSFSPDGQTIASVDHDGIIKLWQVNGKELMTLRRRGSPIYSVSFMRHNGMTTLISSSFDRTITLWRITDTVSKGHKILEGHTDRVWSVSFDYNGLRFASSAGDNTFKLWRAGGGDKAGELLRTFSGHSNSVTRVSFSRNSQLIASASLDKTVKLWHSDNGALIKNLEGHTDWVWGVSISPDSQTIASAGNDRTIRLWDSKGSLIKVIDNAHKDWIFDVNFSPDGQMLASASRDKTIKLWRTDGTLIKTLEGHNDLVSSVKFSPDGKLLASSSGDKTIKLWRVRDGFLLRTFQGHKEYVLGLSFSKDGQTIASASWDHTIKLWKIDGSLIATLQGHSDEVNGVSFSPDGKWLASASKDRTVILWDLTSLHSLELSDLMHKGCDVAHDYLRTKSNVYKDDSSLCK